MSDPNFEDAGAAKARRARNIAMLVILLAFVAIVFAVTILKMSGHAPAAS